MKQFVSSLSEKNVDEEVLLAGWVHSRRDMGKLIFLDLRDSTGLVQVVCVPQEMSKEAFQKVSDVRIEYVVEIKGIIQKRGEKQINKDIQTGTIEVLAKDFVILNKSETPPFEIENEDRQAREDLRLQYRYLDLRHERMAYNMKMRHNVMQFVRNHLASEGFTEMHTPILSKSTPEGARDYLVPSRLHNGKFFALPQSPQQYKQLLMVAGVERYFQMAPCFRDEDARADRSPGEFYQIDMEMSFVNQDDILNICEKMFTKLIKELFPDKKITQSPWPRLAYKEAMEKYKSDKPDLRKNKEDPNELAFTWIVDFPLFTEQTEEDFFHGAGDKWGPSHHMFTAPNPEDVEILNSDTGKVRGLQHDLALNGFEVGGGSIRIHDPKIQEKIFDLIGFTDKQKKLFEHTLKAFTYGVPPHGGVAFGFERIMMILMGEKSLREIIPFPLTTDGRDPMMDSPTKVEKHQLDDVGLELKKE